jgi:microcystin-dependent protein
MANYEATKYNFSGADLTGIEGIPTATIVPWSASSVPTGFLECNGALVSRTTYSALFAIVGTTYGAGDGSSTFALPDLQDNVPLGKSGTKALASTGGANTVSSTGNVGGTTANATLSTSQLASHSHTIRWRGNANIGTTQSIQTNLQIPSASITQENAGTVGTTSTGSGTGHAHNMSATFSGDATSVIQPYIAVIYIIKT